MLSLRVLLVIWDKNMPGQSEIAFK